MDIAVTWESRVMVYVVMDDLSPHESTRLLDSDGGHRPSHP